MQTVSMATLPSPLGPLTVAATDQAICSIEFGECRELPSKLSQRLLARGPVWQRNRVIRELERELKHYFKGKLKTFETPRVWIGTDFQQSVWRALEAIPFGRTMTYQEVALAIENAKAVRAVGGACGANPIPIVVPCHRVLAAGHQISGYSGGLDKKIALLRLEGVVLV